MVDHDEKVPALALYSLIPRKFQIKFIFAIAFRVLSNLLDLVALGGVAVLALSITKVSDPADRNVSIPVFGEFQVSDSSALIISLAIVALFVGKSIISIWFMTWIGKLASECEAAVSRELLLRYFASNLATRRPITQADISGVFLVSLSALLSGSIISFVTICSEGTLLLFLLITFLIFNPLATLSLGLYFLVLLGVLNWVSFSVITSVSKKNYDVSLETLSAAQNLFLVEKELYTLGLAESWIEKVVSLRAHFSKLSVSMTRNNSLPRYVVESGLVVGIFLFIGSIIIFSDLASQAATIGVFLTGGFRLVSSVLPLQSSVYTWRQALVTGRPAFDILQQRSTEVFAHEKRSGTAPKGPISIAVKNLTIPSPSGGKDLLHDLSFEVAAGSKIAVTGPSGAGKSTLLSSLLGIFDQCEGSVFLDGVPIRSYLQDNKGRVAYAPQMPILINGTIVENVTLQTNEANFDLKRIRALLQQLGILARIESLPQGLHTVVSPDLKVLSGGEIQRIGLARALYSKPGLLLLDEVTSALDRETESAISKVLDELRGQVTMVLVSHRAAPIENADKCLTLRSGRLA